MAMLGGLSAGLLVIITSVVLYFNTTFCGFVFDDISAILNNKDLEVDAAWSNLIWNDYWGTPISLERSHKSYRPLTVLTFKLNNLIFGRDGWSYHAINVLLHAVVSTLYLKLCLVVCETSSRHNVEKKNKQRTDIQNGRVGNGGNTHNSLDEKWWRVAYIAAALFTVHPIHTEAVAGVVGRAELLCALFMILTFLSYAKLRPLYLLLATIFCVCAVASKEQGITMVAICIVFDFFIAHKLSPLEFVLLRKTSNIYVGLRSAILCFVMCCVLYWRITIMGDGLPSFLSFDNPSSVSATPVRQLTYNYILAVNAWVLMNPGELLCDWTLGTVPLINGISDARNLATVLFWVILLGLSWIAASKKDSNSKLTLMGMSLLVFPFIPASNLFFPVGFVIAERVLYLPSMGYCLLVAIGFEKLLKYTKLKRFIVCVFAAICVCYSVKTILRNSQWKSDYTLFQSGLRVTKNNAKIWNNVGHSLELENPGKALLYFMEGAKVQPNDIGSHMNVGRVQKSLGYFKEAEIAYRTAKKLLPKRVPGKRLVARIAPDHLQLFVQFGNLLKMNKSRWAEADDLYKEAVSLRNDFADAYINRGEILMLMGKYSDAVECYQNALKYSNKKDDMYFNLGVVHSQMGNISGAVEYYTYAIQANPYHIKALYNSAVIFEETGREDLIKRAKVRVEKILEIEPNNYLALSLLGSIHLDNKDENTATNHWRKVLEIHPDDKSALYNMAYMYSKNDNVVECLKYVEILLHYHPAYVKGLMLYGQVLLNKKRDTKAAANAFSRIIEADPKNIQARHNFCVCILEEGRLVDAEKCMHDVYLMAPEAKYVADNFAIIKKHIAKKENLDADRALKFAKEGDLSGIQESKESEKVADNHISEEEDIVFVEPIHKKVIKKTSSKKAKVILMDAQKAAKLATENEGDDKLEHLENALKKAQDAVKQLNEMNSEIDKDMDKKCTNKHVEFPSKMNDKAETSDKNEDWKRKALDHLDQLEADLS